MIRPIALVVPSSVNHRLPSAPEAMPVGALPAFSPAENSLIAPPGVIRPIALLPGSVNHRLPSAPGAIEIGKLRAFRPAENSLICPSGAGAATDVVGVSEATSATAATIAARSLW